MDRLAALRILGLPPSAGEAEMRAAWWLLRAHVEARLVAARTPEAREARARELREVAAIGEAFGLAAVPRPAARERWLLGWATAATLLALGLGLWLAGREGPPRALAEGAGGAGDGGYAIEGEGEPGGSAGGGAAETIARAERARVVADAGVEEARIEIVDADAPGGDRVAEGAADGSAFWLAPGRYTLRVSHPDCPDAWERTLDAEGGSDHVLTPEICAGTGWLVVQANVEGARVRVDGRAVGNAGPERRAVAAGEREVRVEGPPGYEDWEGIVDLEARRSLTLRPRLVRRDPPADAADPAESAASEPVRAPSPVEAAAELATPPGPQGGDAGGDGLGDESDPELSEGWHHEARGWLLARYDADRSGAIDRPDELAAVPCDEWKGIERSYDESRLGLPLLRMYGFDGDGWKPGALGVASGVRDLAFRRLRDCGLRY